MGGLEVLLSSLVPPSLIFGAWSPDSSRHIWMSPLLLRPTAVLRLCLYLGLRKDTNSLGIPVSKRGRRKINRKCTNSCFEIEPCLTSIFENTRVLALLSESYFFSSKATYHLSHILCFAATSYLMPDGFKNVFSFVRRGDVSVCFQLILNLLWQDFSDALPSCPLLQPLTNSVCCVQVSPGFPMEALTLPICQASMLIYWTKEWQIVGDPSNNSFDCTERSSVDLILYILL